MDEEYQELYDDAVRDLFTVQEQLREVSKERDALRAELAAIKGEFEAQGIHDWDVGGWADTNYPTLAKLMRGDSDAE